ncbi:MAG: glycosyltransferase [Planctomycetes bacterium]|nr:glycosyltransferase [Planctomycetota bacterium]
MLNRIAHTGHRINVVLLTSSLERGGAERQVVELANAIDPGMFNVRVITLSTNNPLASDLRDASDRLIALPKRYTYDLPLILRTARVLSKLDAAIVHSFMFDAEIVGRLAGRLARVPAVICSNRCPLSGPRQVQAVGLPCDRFMFRHHDR